MADQTAVDYYNRRLSQMDKERQSFISHYTELSDFMQPRRGRFFVSDRNKGDKRHNNIINSAAGQALQIARSGMLAGTMSPSRPWFDLEPNDPDMLEDQEVKEWITAVVRQMRAIFNASNLYGQASVMLGELLTFGTGCMLHVDDFDDVSRFYTQTVGNYYLAQNSRLEVDTLAREFEWTVRQIVMEFGLENTSQFVKNAWAKGDYETWVPITQFIEPNTSSPARPELAIDKPFSSVYFEPGNQGPDRDKFLRKSGFDFFPAYCPRWETTVEDIYGTNCPGMMALGDVKSLQSDEREKAKAVEKMVSPPMGGPPSLKSVPVNTLPSGLTIYSGGVVNQKLEPLYQLTAPIQEMRIDMDAVTQRINSAFFVDLFLAITAQAGIQPRNELEILSKNEERLLQLGPVLERIHGEFLENLIDRQFAQMVKANILPPIPPQLEGQNLKVKFISNLAIAQRAVVTGNLDRILAATTAVAQIDESAVIKLDSQQYIDEYAKAIGVPPKVIRSDDQVAEIEEEQAKAAQAERTLAGLQSGSETAKNLANAPVGDDSNVLTELSKQQ